MMKQKLIIALALLILLAALVFMIKDFFFDSEKSQKNPYAYELHEFENVNDNQICYDEIFIFEPEVDELKGIAVDDNDNIYVSGGKSIKIFDPSGKFLSSINTKHEVGALTVAKNRDVFVSAKDHIEIWSRNGELIASWESIDKCLITSIAVGESDVFVADAGNKIVYRYNLSGELQNKIGRKNKAKGIAGFFIPSPYFDLLIGRDDELWVVNPGMHTFEAYNYEGEQISSWKRTSVQLDGFSGCCNPSHIALLSDGSFVTSEKGLVRVKIHEPSGDYKCVVAQSDQFDKETRGLDLAVDSQDRILILDPKRKLVRIFDKK